MKMKKLILNKEIIKEIQSQLRGLNWMDSPEKRGELFAFLEGVRLAYITKGLEFDLCIQREIHSVNVWQYADYTDCWSEKRLLLKIYEDSITENQSIKYKQCNK